MMPNALKIALVAMCLLTFQEVLPAASSQVAEPPKTAVDFVAQFKDAFSGASLTKAQGLFYWHRVSEAQRIVIVQMIERDLAYELVDIKLLPLGSGPSGFQDNEQRYRPNARLVGHLLAKFVDDAKQVHYSMHMVGIAAGGYYIALAVPDGLQAI